jgi:hypothetical protein
VDARDEALEVGQPPRELLEVAEERRVVHDLLDRVETGVDRSRVAERVAEPDAEEPLAERSDALLQERIKRAVGAALRVDEDLRGERGA